MTKNSKLLIIMPLEKYKSHVPDVVFTQVATPLFAGCIYAESETEPHSNISYWQINRGIWIIRKKWRHHFVVLLVTPALPLLYHVFCLCFHHTPGLKCSWITHLVSLHGSNGPQRPGNPDLTGSSAFATPKVIQILNSCNWIVLVFRDHFIW